MPKTEKIYQQLAETLAKLFSPLAEVSLYGNDHKLITVYNRLTQEVLPPLLPHQEIQLSINKNQRAKAVKIPLSGGYYLRLIVETNLFESLQTFLNQYLSKPTENALTENMSWQTLIENVIDSYCQKKNIGLSALSAQDKRAIVHIAHEKDLLRYQEASKYLANTLSVSRATIYNYLNQAAQMKTLQIHQVDAFTDEPYSGNPAGVVLDADKLDESMMKKITREMNLSETAFLFPSKKADIKLRYFTPTGSEVKFCGHSTVAALYMLAHKKMLGIDKPGRYELTLEAKIGLVKAAISLEKDNSITVLFQTPKIDLVKSNLSHELVAQALGIPLTAIDRTKPVMFEKNNQDLYITITSLKNLGELQVDNKSAKLFAEKHHIVAFALLCNEAISKKNHIHMRCFAPSVGIPEDPFTGSVLGGLSAYIIQNKLIDKSLKMVRVEQGHFISRPGYVELQLDPSHPNDSPTVFAKAHHFFSTEINL